MTDALGNVTTNTYDAPGNVVSVTDANGSAAITLDTQYYRDIRKAFGIIDASGEGKLVAALTQSNKDLLLASFTTRYEYDKNNRLLTETRPLLAGQTLPHTVLHRYDANGNEIETTDEHGHITRYVFDKDDRNVLITDANSINTVFQYDSRDNVTTIAIGVQASVNAAGQVVIADASGAQVSTFVYDEFSQLIAKTDGLGNTMHYEYDRIGN